MLFNLVLGETNNIKLENGEEGYEGVTWTCEENDKGKSYLYNPFTFQRINLGKYVKGKITSIYNTRNEEDGFSVSCYSFPKDTYFKRYLSNYNLVLLNAARGSEGLYEGEHVIYITILDKDYKLIEYDTVDSYDVFQTYKSKDKFKGLCLEFLLPNSMEDICIFSVLVKRMPDDTFIRHEIFAKRVTNGAGVELYLSSYIYDSVADVRKFGEIIENNPNIFFKTIDKAGIATSAFVTTNKNTNYIRTFADSIGEDLIIYETDIRTLDSTSPKFSKEDSDKFSEYIREKGIKSITVVGSRSPKNFCKDYKIKYLYNLDPKTSVSKCVKSN